MDKGTGTLPFDPSALLQLRVWLPLSSWLMGIPGLLGALKSVTYPIHVSSYRGLTVGVDAYCWLHRGAFSCGTELCTGVATEKYVAFCMKRINLLLHHGVQPIMVFDGASLPMKRNINLERRRQRQSAQSKGEAALAAGEAGAAAQHFSKAVGVTHDMAFQFMKTLRQAGVRLIVAPYEADAQLAFLSRTGAVDVVLTEDSDCLPYGCKKVLFKMDNQGHGQEIQLRNLTANSPLSLCNWKNSMFLDLCLLVGCDYITASIKGLGIATAHKLVASHRSLDKIISAVNSSKFVVPEGYWEQYKRARVTFRHHIIYNPQTETTMHLMPLGDTAKQLANLHFLGTHLQPPVTRGVANGWLLPTNHQPYETSELPEDSEKRPPTPLQEAKMRPPEGPAEHNPQPAPEASVDDTDVCGDLSWDQDTGRGLDPSSEKGGDGEIQRTTQVPLSRAFIDNPFRARRLVLRELSSAGPGGAGWGVAAADATATWATQESHRPSGSTGHTGVHEVHQRFGLESQDLLSGVSTSPDNKTPLWSSVPVPCLLKNDEGGMGGVGVSPRWREGHDTGNLDQRDEGVDWQKPAWGESGDEEKEADVRHGGGQTNTNCPHHPHQDELAFRGSGGAETRTDQECEVEAQQGGGALALMGEPYDADHTKFVPASAQEFNSTQVSRGLETLQRRKRRLRPAGDPNCPGLPTKQPQEAEPDGEHNEEFEENHDGDGAAWMVQPAEPETSHDSRGILFFSKGSSHDPPASLRHRSPTSPTRDQVLTASSRRWTLPSRSGMPSINGDQLPLLRLLDGQGRSSGTRASQPLPKRTRGIDFWDAQLLR